MGNGYYNNNNHHSIHHHHHHFHQKSIFFPMLCRLSIKDINKLDNRIPTETDPSSPKVSCIGQVKRNNRVIGFPTTTTTAATPYHHKYSKLKKLFSSKTLLPPAPTVLSTTSGGGVSICRSGSKSCRTRKEMRVNNSRLMLRLKNECDGDEDSCVHEVVNIGEMDPPLPVVKKVAPPPNEINIWKRRFNGTGLKSLEIEQINLPSCKIQPPTTV